MSQREFKKRSVTDEQQDLGVLEKRYMVYVDYAFFMKKWTQFCLYIYSQSAGICSFLIYFKG